jgi:hypothetical protein
MCVSLFVGITNWLDVRHVIAILYVLLDKHFDHTFRVRTVRFVAGFLVSSFCAELDRQRAAYMRLCHDDD